MLLEFLLIKMILFVYIKIHIFYINMQLYSEKHMFS